jgi:endonuclease G, mitochondrial
MMGSWRLWQWLKQLKQSFRQSFVILLVPLFLLTGCTGLLNAISIGQTSPHLLLGKPSDANAFNANDYLIIRPQYTLAYNRDKGIANWVSWQLNQDWLGSLPRPLFAADANLPQGWYQVQPRDYTASGFDRGHLVPAADRNKTVADSESVFVMTNILPQAPDNNQGPWERFESYCRNLVQQGKELYIIAGSSGAGGIGLKGKRVTIAKGKVTVPEQLWKVAVVLDQPGLTINSVTERTPVFAVIMPNQQGIKELSWKTFQTSIDAVEELTGYDFLSNIPKPIQAVLEAKK